MASVKTNTVQGRGFAIHELIIHAVKDFKDINPRLKTLTLKTDNVDIVLINEHAPTEEKEEEEKEFLCHTSQCV